MSAFLLKKYKSIDLSKISEKDQAVLEKVKVLTSDFTLEDEGKNKTAEQIIDKLIAKYPEAIIVEKKAEPKPVKKNNKVKAATKSKTSKKDGASSASPSPKKSIFSVAKEIRKEGESWLDAQARAREIIKKQNDKQNASRESELKKLLKIVKTRKELRGFKNSDIVRDSVRSAKPRGVRTVTKEGVTSNQYGTFQNRVGRKYWETRDGHGDRLSPAYPKGLPKLEYGGEFMTDPNFGDFQNQVYLNGGKIDNNINFTQIDYDRLVGDSSENYPFYSVKSGNSYLIKKDENEKIVAKWFPDTFVLKIKKPQDESLLKWLYKNDYISDYEFESFELGGNILPDLAGHMGGKFGTGDPSMLNGFTGTHYDGLVGETGAMSAGELFEKGGKINIDFPVDVQKGLSEKQQKMYDSYINHYNELVDKNLELKQAKRRKDKEEVKRLNTKILGLKYSINFIASELYKDKKLTEYISGYNPNEDNDDMYMYGGAMMQNQAIIDAASQSYVNYYLGEGASAGIFKDGGGIPNNYLGKYYEDIWDKEWTTAQKYHFLSDHQNEIGFDEVMYNEALSKRATKEVKSSKGTDLGFKIIDSEKLVNTKYSELPRYVKFAVEKHLREGQYAYGGRTKSQPSMKELAIEQIASLTGVSKSSLSNFIDRENLTEQETLAFMQAVGINLIKKTDVAVLVSGDVSSDKYKELKEKTLDVIKSKKMYEHGGSFRDKNDGFLEIDNERKFRSPFFNEEVETFDIPIDLSSEHIGRKSIDDGLEQDIDLNSSGIRTKMTYGRGDYKKLASVNPRVYEFLVLPKNNSSEQHRTEQ